MPFRIFGTAFFIIERIANAKQVFYYCIVICKRMGFLKISVLAAAISVVGFGCSTDGDVARYVDGMLIDLSEFGCKWVLEVPDDRLEPNNISEFSIDLTDSLKVRFAYVEDDDQTSECFFTVVRLLDIYEK